MRSYVLYCIVFLSSAFSQDMLDVKTTSPKTYLRAEVFENYVRYASNEDIRAKKDLKQTYFYILGNLSQSIPYSEQLNKWSIIENLIHGYESKPYSELLELYLESENEVREGVACAIWKKSLTTKKASAESLSLLETIKEQLNDDSNGLSTIISSYLVLEAAMQNIVNDGVVADFYHMIYSPESTSIFDDEEGIIETFEFSPVGYLADYYAADFKYPILNKILNRVVYFDKKEAKPSPLRNNTFTLMVRAGNKLDPSIQNKTNKTVEIKQLDNKGNLIRSYSVGPNLMLVFKLNGFSKITRIKLDDGREFEISSYKKYHLEKIQ